MKKLRIKEAIARASLHGITITQTAIAARLWPDRPKITQQVNMGNLISGRRASVMVEWVPIICEMCGCSADFLFGLSND